MDEFFGIFTPIASLGLPCTTVIQIYEGFHGSVYGHLMENTTIDVDWVGSNLRESPLEILDLCCGLGRFGRSLAQDGHSVTAVDMSADMVERAREMTDAGSETIDYVVGDATRIDYKREFDAVVVGGLSYCIVGDKSARAGVLKAARRSLRDGGFLFFDYMPTPSFSDDREMYQTFPMPGDTEKAFMILGVLQSPSQGVQRTNMYSELISDEGTQRFLSTETVRYVDQVTLKDEVAEAGFEILEQSDISPNIPGKRDIPRSLIVKCKAVG